MFLILRLIFLRVHALLAKFEVAGFYTCYVLSRLDSRFFSLGLGLSTKQVGILSSLHVVIVLTKIFFTRTRLSFFFDP